MGRRRHSESDWVPCFRYGGPTSVNVLPGAVLEVETLLVQNTDVGLGAHEVAVPDNSEDLTVLRVVGSFRIVSTAGSGAPGLYVSERIRKGLLDNDGNAAFFADAFESGGGLTEPDEDANEPFLWQRYWTLSQSDVNNWLGVHPWYHAIDSQVNRKLEVGEALFHSLKVLNTTATTWTLLHTPFLRSYVRK